MSDEKIREYVGKVVRSIRVTKVVATRSVKTKSGDFFSGFSSAYDSRQEEGYGADLGLIVPDEDVIASGMTLLDAKVAHIMISVEASLAAWRAAYIDGAISEGELAARGKHIKQKASLQIKDLLKDVKALQSED